MSQDRIAVLICPWGAGERPAFQLEPLRARSEELEGVVLAKVVGRLCTKEGAGMAAEALRSSGADRFVVAACPLLDREPLLRDVAEAAGLHPLAFEAADIREGAAYVHEAAEAQGKALRLIAMAVEKVRLWSPPPLERRQPHSRRVAVVGGGLTAALAARDLLSQGLEVDLLVPDQALVEPPGYLFSDDAQSRLAREALQEVRGDARATVRFNARATACEGRPGDFQLFLEEEGEVGALECGAVVLAPEPVNRLRMLDGSPAPWPEELRALGPKAIAVLPGGKSSGAGCSCITPRGTLFAMELMRSLPGTQVHLLGREWRALGAMEEVQREAQRRGVAFHRLEAEPSVRGGGPHIISFQDPLAGPVEIHADLVLVDSVEVGSAESLASIFRLPLDERGELLSIEPRLRPGETVREGVFACRYRVGNMLFEDVAREAGSAAARAGELLRPSHMEVGGAVAEVEPERCSVCLACLRICPYSAPYLGQGGKVEIDVQLCQGCGACLPLCPSRAIDMYQFSSAQVVAQERAALRRSS